MTTKEKMYQNAVKEVAKLLTTGCGLTEARTRVGLRFGLSYPTMVKITKTLKHKEK